MFSMLEFLFSFFVVEASDSNSYYPPESYGFYVYDYLFSVMPAMAFIVPELVLALVLLLVLCVYVFQLNKSNSVRYIKSVTTFFFFFFLFLVFLEFDTYMYLDWKICDYPINSYFFSGYLVYNWYIFLLKLLTLIAATIFFFILQFVIKYYWFIQVEHIVLMGFSILGSLFLIASNDLLTFYLSLEISTIPLYILVAAKSRCNFSTEAGLKYFIMGSFSSGLILFGLSFLYGFSGVVCFDEFYVYLLYLDSSDLNYPFLVLGFLLFTIGLLVKIGVAPLHFWVIDVYSGAPLVVTFFMMFVPKVALWGVSFNLIMGPFYPFFIGYTSYLLCVCIIASFVLGIFPGLYQVKIKRLIIYSSIASNGFFLLAFFAGSATPLMSYLTVYLYTLSGFFAFYLSLRKQASLKVIKKISELNNLYAANKELAYAGSIILFSMAGIPPLAGFMVKFHLFQTAFSYMSGLILFILFISCASTFYYIRLSKWMFFSNSLNPSSKNTYLFLLPVNPWLALYLYFCILFLITFIFSFDGLILYMDDYTECSVAWFCVDLPTRNGTYF